MNIVLCIMCVINTHVGAFHHPEIDKTSWPLMKNFDIWNTAVNVSEEVQHPNRNVFTNVKNTFSESKKGINLRRSKVFHLFPIPVDGECLSNDGRRIGTCFNVYECRLKGGLAKGDCSMGFGVCCIFVASCGETISNNITYLVSPNFPSSMPSNISACKVKVKMMDSNISQLRIDFNHFSLGQPNRKTGICDGDVFNIGGGLLGNFSLCGQNSGQHFYYDVDERNYGRQISTGTIRPTLNNNLTTVNNNFYEEGSIEITLSLTNRIVPIRFWEIRIAQIPFSQRAPAGCLQYFTNAEGIIQTFNFAENGRHLANQHYKSCIRQEDKMCSIMYQPCDDQSFKIGPTALSTSMEDNNMPMADLFPLEDNSLPITQAPEILALQTSSILTSNNQDFTQSETSTVSSNLNDNEGSGDANIQPPVLTSRPVRGGFDIISFFRSAFNFRGYRRSSKQFFTTCTDRITMPCIVEDFVGIGMGPLPGCEPVHCGSQFCTSGTKPCRIESTVTPFYLGVNFGDGSGKGSAEDNIGACIRYSQMQCV